LLRLRYFPIAFLLWLPELGVAAEDWSLCRAPSFQFVENEGLQPQETLVEARTIVSEDSESIHLVGEVSLRRERQTVFADDIRIDKSSERIEASGNTIFADRNYRLKSGKIVIDNRNDSARFDNPEFELRGRHARGVERVHGLGPRERGQLAVDGLVDHGLVGRARGARAGALVLGELRSPGDLGQPAPDPLVGHVERDPAVAGASLRDGTLQP